MVSEYLVFSEAIKDKKVVGAKGVLIGKVEGIDFSADTWKVTTSWFVYTTRLSGNLAINRAYELSRMY